MPLSTKGIFSDPELVELDSISFAMIRKAVAVTEIPDFYSFAFAEVFEELSKQRLSISGPPAGLTFSPPNDVIELGAAFPFRGQLVETDLVQMAAVEPGKAVRVTVVGSYEAVPQAYVLIRDFIEAHGLTPRGFPWESYVTDPSDADEDELTTEVFWPVMAF